jgi:hypothetical protein
MTETLTSTLRKQRRWRPLLKKAALFTASIVFALLVVELVLRLTGFTYFNPYVVDAQLGYSLRPNAEGWWTREGRAYIRINGHGFRDRERSIVKPADTFRIAVLGDSFAEALQVPLEKAFWSVMERPLTACLPAGKNHVEVLNFGVSGFSTARELILLETRVWQYSPDMIVLLFTPGNDVRDNSRALNRYRAQPLPYFVFREDRLVLDDSLVTERNHTLAFRLQNSFPGRWFERLRNNLRVLGLFYTVREALLSPQPADRNRPGELGLDIEVYRPPETREWEDAWRVTETLVVKMRDAVEAHGAKFLLVNGSAGIQVNPDEETRRQFMTTIGVNNLFYSDERLTARAQAAHLTLLTLAPSLQDYASRNHVFVQGTKESGGRGHWNELGHQIVGELIAKEICRQNL